MGNVTHNAIEKECIMCGKVTTNASACSSECIDASQQNGWNDYEADAHKQTHDCDEYFHRCSVQFIDEETGKVEWLVGQKWFDGRIVVRGRSYHRKSGPAVVHADGTEEYWEHGRRMR